MSFMAMLDAAIQNEIDDSLETYVSVVTRRVRKQMPELNHSELRVWVKQAIVNNLSNEDQA